MFERTKPNIVKYVSRFEWGAKHPLKPYINIYPNKVIIHDYEYRFSRTKTRRFDKFNGIETIKSMQSKHIADGLIDIKFHYIISPDGTVYEGRPLGVSGRHCKKQDNNSVAIMFYGNYNIELPERHQIRSFFEIVRHLKIVYKDMKFPSCIFNHNDFEFTLCPGHHLTNMMNVIKSRKDVSYD